MIIHAEKYLCVLQSKNRNEEGWRLYKNKKRICAFSHLLSTIPGKEKTGFQKDQKTISSTDYEASRAVKESVGQT